MPLDLDDGYYLPESTLETWTDSLSGQLWTKLPIVNFVYRPALNPALYRMQFESNRATSGDERLAVHHKLVLDHLHSWDVNLIKKGPNGEKVRIKADLTIENLRLVPPPIFTQIFGKITTWAPDHQAETEKNSESASG